MLQYICKQKNIGDNKIMAEQKATKKEYVTQENLTILQHIALEGEVAVTMLRANTPTEKLIGAYTLLVCCNEKYIYLYKAELSKYLDEPILNDLVSYRYTDIFPVHLFVDRMLDIIRGMLGESCGDLIVREYPVEVIKSKFVVGLREISYYIPELTNAFLDCMNNKIIDDSEADLEFLQPVILVLKNTLGTNPSEKEMPVDSKIKLLSLDIDKLPVMDLDGEVKRVQAEKEFEGLSQKEKIEKCMKKLFGVSDEELSTVQEQEDNQAPVTVYKVKKINKTNGMVVFEKEFDSRKSATEYVKQIVSDYPELTKQYNFEVELVTK